MDKDEILAEELEILEYLMQQERESQSAWPPIASPDTGSSRRRDSSRGIGERRQGGHFRLRDRHRNIGERSSEGRLVACTGRSSIAAL